jgi:hypothetical protein
MWQLRTAVVATKAVMPTATWGLTRHEARFHQRHLDRSGRDMEICPKARRRDKEQSPGAVQIITGLPEYLARIFLVFFLTMAVSFYQFKIN